MAERILIVEDEENIARVLQLELEFEGYEAGVAHAGDEGLIRFREGGWDLVLLDLMLPGLSGLDVLRRIRATDPAAPVILLTAKNDVEDKVAGLDLGANDYVTKPFEIEELLARIRAVLRTAKALSGNGAAAGGNGQPDHVHSFGGVTLDEHTREVMRDGREIELTPREFDLLLHFLKYPNQVFERAQLLDAVWGFDYYGDTNVVDVYVRYVRKKIGDGLIHTVRGVGYVMKESAK
ncbi:response regulator transcription factor [Bhargavaea cecembensis]|uniref:response regulator transcription factor n=1 Tax=Bhargavaea cecembensis TaxID=394098 RepID=UPI00058FFB78|nr:response regulator transcription factor [Bhargavaea cecembensis]